MVVNSFKSTLERSFSSSSTQFATENTRISSLVEKKLLRHVEEKISNEKEKTDSVCGFEKKVDKNYLIFSKSLNDETIAVKFNTNHYVKVEDYKEPTDNGDSEPFKYKINPNFRVEIKRGSATLGFNCIIEDDQSDDGYMSPGKHDSSSDYYDTTYRYFTRSHNAYDDNCSEKKTTTISEENEKSQPNVHQCPDTSMFIIQNYAFNEGSLNENNYQCCGVGNVRDAAMYNIMKNLLREKGICDEFLSEVIFHSKIHETDNHRFFIKNLKKFMKGEPDSSEAAVGVFIGLFLFAFFLYLEYRRK
ncbi:uncharacterized protein LOC135842883 isoform X3 [Planococcus citri]|uniref:uncharacterized protein LOC135842883 isoform X3 n=1 Tax=Planococcus citri TaxID=170843 RepID=UPI0031F74C4E